MRDLSGGKDAEHTAGFQPSKGFLHPREVRAHRLVTAEGIDQDEEIPELRDVPQQEVCHDLHIGPPAFQERCQQQSFEAAEGVICHDDAWSRGGDALDIDGIDAAPGIEYPEDAIFRTVAVRDRLGLRGDVVEPVEGENPFDARCDRPEDAVDEGVRRTQREMETVCGGEDVDHGADRGW